MFTYTDSNDLQIELIQYCDKMKELPPCPVEVTLQLIGDKWKVLILRELMPEKKRFGELQKSISNVSQRMLTQQLKAMEKDGLINRTAYAEIPPRVEYSLTELGRSLEPILDSMNTWGNFYRSVWEECNRLPE